MVDAPWLVERVSTRSPQLPWLRRVSCARRLGHSEGLGQKWGRCLVSNANCFAIQGWPTPRWHMSTAASSFRCTALPDSGGVHEMCWAVVSFLGTCAWNGTDVLERCIGRSRRQGSALQVQKVVKRLGIDWEVWAQATSLNVSGAVIRSARQQRGDARARKQSHKLTQSISISTALLLLTLAAWSGWRQTMDARTFCDSVLEAFLRTPMLSGRHGGVRRLCCRRPCGCSM